MKSSFIRTSMANHNEKPPSCSAIRFLGLLKQPDSDPTPFELDESDVLWSTSDSPTLPFTSPAKSPPPIPPSTALRQTIFPKKPGLSAALNPSSTSTASKARSIRRTGLGESSRLESGRFHPSAPVDAQVWPTGSSGVVYEADEREEEEMVPPHEIVARSQMARFSVCEGLGRTLKGRDLRRVRNAVWQKTGFLEQ